MLPKSVQKDVTVFHAAETLTGASWTSFVVQGASWRADYGRKLTEKGVSTADTVSVLVLKSSLPDGFIVTKDDKMINRVGLDTPPEDAFTIIEIIDNDFGSQNMRHLRIIGR